ncbi:unnamed protein product, partial [marine sediment metagenome]
MQPFVINRRTEFRNIRLIDENKGFYDSIFIVKAKDMAKNAGLDLVCFNKPERNKLALCKIIDYGKWKYSQKKDLKKQQQLTRHSVKEVRFSPVIGQHDIEHKLKQVKEFICEGDEVLLTMRFKGIHRRHQDLGLEKMDDIVAMCTSYS